MLILHRSRLAHLSIASQADVLAYARKGGAVIFVGRGLALGDAAWGREVGGAGWVEATRTLRDLHLLNFQTDAHLLTRDLASFNLDCEIVYDHELDPSVQVLCSAFTPKLGKGRATGEKVSIYDIQAQAWAWEAKSHRAVTLLQGESTALAHRSIRALLQRAVAWVSGAADLDAGIAAENLVDLRYPVGGPRRADRTAAGFKLPPGFTATAMASEPMVRKPIAIQCRCSWRPTPSASLRLKTPTTRCTISRFSLRRTTVTASWPRHHWASRWRAVVSLVLPTPVSLA